MPFAHTQLRARGVPVGGGLPDWVPQPGGVSVINLNELSSVNPCPSGTCWYSQSSKQAAPWRNWTGAAWCPGFSERGAVAFNGGGHGGGEDHGLYVFDFTSRLWSRVGVPVPTTNYTDEAEANVDWYDYLHHGSYIFPALHTYNYPAYIPPGSPGVGPKGAWVLPQLVGGANSGAIPHGVDLDSGLGFRVTTGRGASGASPYSGSFTDTTRGKIWWATNGLNTINAIAFAGAHPRVIEQREVSFFASAQWYGRYIYVPEADAAIGFGTLYAQTNVTAQLLVMSTGIPVTTAMANIPVLPDAINAGYGADWCPETASFYFYPGAGDTRVYKVTPSSMNFATCTWTVTVETFSNPLWYTGPNETANRQGAASFSRWRYIPTLKCFVWTDGPHASALCVDGVTRTGAVQIWRPLGT